MRQVKTAEEAAKDLKSYVGNGQAVLRVAGLGIRGLRWSLDSIDPKGVALLTSEDGSRSCKASVLDVVIAPISSRQNAAAVGEARPKPSVSIK